MADVCEPLAAMIATGETHIAPTQCQLTDDLACLVRINPSETGGYLILLEDVSAYHEREKYQHDAMHMVAHDLKTPISVIKSYADLIKNMGQLSPPQEQFLGRILLAAENMSSLVSDLLDLAWIDANSPLELTATRLEFALNNSMESLQSTAKTKHINLVTEYAENLPTLLADTTRLQRVFTNLIANAIKFSPEGTTITVRARQLDAKELEVAVIDEGCGISAEHLPYIFTRFYQAPNALEDQSATGSGLGLAICSAIVEKHGGLIRVESEPERGTTFYVHLPIGGHS